MLEREIEGERRNASVGSKRSAESVRIVKSRDFLDVYKLILIWKRPVEQFVVAGQLSISKQRPELRRY